MSLQQIILPVKALVAMVASPKQVADTVAQATARLAMAVVCFTSLSRWSRFS